MKEKLHDYFEELVKEGIFPGVSYAIYYQDKTIIDSAGMISSLENKKTTKDTLYDIASLTKVVVTNTLFLMAEEKGMVSSSDFFCQYFPTFPYPDIKLIHLLNHSSGLVPTYDKYHLTSKEEFFTKISQKNEPGADVIYSDLNYILLGFLMEKIYDTPLDVLAEQKIFKPLSMDKTTFHPKKEECAPTEDTKERGLLWGIVHDEKAYFLNGVAGHAGVFSTPSDLLQFGKKLLFNDGTFLTKKSINCLFKKTIISSSKVARSYSWMLASTYPDTKEFASKKAIFHTGFTGCAFLIDQEQKLILIILSNRVYPTRENKLFFERRKEYNKRIYELLKEEEHGLY